ncbi:MAG: NAAT family transporter [Candidatus Kuenenia sp.]|nr:NAAT family transporter [Candidatus Kuenenia hertensis]
MEHWTEYTRFLTALMVILDPFAAIPIFLSLTQGYNQTERTRVIFITIVTVALVLIAASISGESLLKTLGTSLASFRVGGGIVLLLMALAMLRAQSDKVKTSPTEKAAAETKETIAVVPLAIPLLAGPGSISTVIIEMHRSSAAYHQVMVILCILFTCILLWTVLRLASSIGKALGPIGLNILHRLFGLILTSIAIEIMANGLRELFPVLS